MKPFDDVQASPTVDDLAAAWVCERAEGFSPERARAFAAWCDRDPRHVAAVVQAERALGILEEMPAIRTSLEARFGRREDAGPATARASARVLWFPARARVAAFAAALVMGAVSWWTLSSRAPDLGTAAAEHYSADAGAGRRVALRDGSVIDINRASAVQVDFSDRARNVQLNAGEADFKVAADAARPFIVKAGGVSVRAVGTAFNVRYDARGEVEVVVLEGTVEVTRAKERATVTAGHRTQVSGNQATTPQVEKAAPETIRAVLSWQDAMTTFNDVPLRDVMTRMNQRNTIQLVLEEPQLGERKVGGVIAIDQVEAFVRLLEQDGDVVAERVSSTEIRLRRAQ